MTSTIRFTRKTYKAGDSLVITLPKEIQEYLQIEEGTQIELQPENGKHGKYITLWKKKETQ